MSKSRMTMNEDEWLCTGNEHTINSVLLNNLPFRSIILFGKTSEERQVVKGVKNEKGKFERQDLMDL